jgi:TctA family transporter
VGFLGGNCGNFRGHNFGIAVVVVVLAMVTKRRLRSELWALLVVVVAFGLGFLVAVSVDR